MKEFYEVKKQLQEQIANSSDEELEVFFRNLHDFIVKQDKTIREQKRNSRFKSVMEIGLENLELHEKIFKLE
jgi:hypothetical protein